MPVPPFKDCKIIKTVLKIILHDCDKRFGYIALAKLLEFRLENIY